MEIHAFQIPDRVELPCARHGGGIAHISIRPGTIVTCPACAKEWSHCLSLADLDKVQMWQ